MREIGGYLELDIFKGKEYYSDAIALNSARNSLVYLSKAKKIDKIYIPYFLCDSISKVCDREKIKYDYYHINEDFTPNFNQELMEGEYLYLVNYYGQISYKKLKEYKKKFGNLIIDNVQAFFEKPISHVDTIYSCRKFFGVSDGAYLFSNCNHLNLETDHSKDRLGHVLGRMEEEQASLYYKVFQQNDEKFDELELKNMSKTTHNFLRAINYKDVRKKREKNWRTLHKFLEGKNQLKLTMPCGPYMFPFYVKNGESLRRSLAEEKIYIPMLWPNVLKFENCDLEKDYAKNILPLPIDQRYGKEEMLKIAESIIKLL